MKIKKEHSSTFKNFIDFNVNATSGTKVGRVRWNATDRCIEYDSYINGSTVTNQIGQEVWVRVRNNTGSTITNGKAVYVTGALGNRPTVALADASNQVHARAFLGITTESISNNEDGFVTVIGSVRSVDTSAFIAGDLLYVSATTAGELTNVSPIPPNRIISVGHVTVENNNNGEIAVLVSQEPIAEDIPIEDAGDYFTSTNVEGALQELGAGGGGGGSTTFTGLSDTPSSYTSQAGKTVRVNSGETALEFVQGLTPTQITDLTDGGDSTLHYHATDRARANHTGTQLASTISDFDTEVSNNASVSANTAKVSADGSIDTHSDVDITTDPVAKNDVLMYNGTTFVPVPEGTTFTFSCTGFSDGETTTQLIGSGTVFADSTMSYTATYENGPPTTADVKMSINGGAYNTVGAMTGPAYTSGTNSGGAISYPASKDQYLRFRLDSDDGTDFDIDYDTSIYFRNYIFWGVASKNSGFTEADVEALSGSAISNDQTRSEALNAGVGEYLVFAFPSSYTSINATGFLFNSVVCPFETAETVSITNSAGYTENYKVYASSTANLGSSTLTTSTASSIINPFYYGGSTLNTGWSEAQIKALTDVQSPITNDTTQTFNTVTLGASEYFVFAYPSRLTDPTNWFDNSTGFALSLNAGSPETVSITNENGYTENYDVWVSNNILGPGSFQLRTS